MPGKSNKCPGEMTATHAGHVTDILDLSMALKNESLTDSVEYKEVYGQQQIVSYPKLEHVEAITQSRMATQEAVQDVDESLVKQENMDAAQGQTEDDRISVGPLDLSMKKGTANVCAPGLNQTIKLEESPLVMSNSTSELDQAEATAVEVNTVDMQDEIAMESDAEMNTFDGQAEITMEGDAEVNTLDWRAEITMEADADRNALDGRTEITMEGDAKENTKDRQAEIPVKAEGEVNTLDGRAEITMEGDAEGNVNGRPVKITDVQVDSLRGHTDGTTCTEASVTLMCRQAERISEGSEVADLRVNPVYNDKEATLNKNKTVINKDVGAIKRRKYSRRCRSHNGQKNPSNADNSVRILRNRQVALHSDRTSRGRSTKHSSDICTTAAQADPREHPISHTKQKSYICAQCDHKFDSERSLRSHMKLHRGDKKRATIASNKTSTKKCDGVLSKKSIKRPNQDDANLCWFCGFQASKRKKLLLHIRLHKNKKPYLCSHCGYRATQWDQLKNHLVTHSQEKPYVCSVCDRRFSLKVRLVRHMRRHTGEKLFSCPHCEYMSLEKSTLIGHLYTHSTHGIFKCPFCEFTSDHHRSLSGHMCIHFNTETKRVAFSSKEADSKRSSNIAVEEVYKCAACSYSTARKGDFLRHKRIHSGEKPHKCPHCDYSSIRKSGLVVHMQKGKHGSNVDEEPHKEKPYKCSFCDYSSNFKSDRTRHMRMHTGEMPYKCTVCDYSSIRKAYLATHMKKHNQKIGLDAKLFSGVEGSSTP